MTPQTVSKFTYVAALTFGITTQVLDGIFTYIGVSVGFPEGNPLLAAAMDRFGMLNALIAFKVLGCLCCLWLAYHSRFRAIYIVSWITFVLGPLGWASLLLVTLSWSMPSVQVPSL